MDMRLLHLDPGSSKTQIARFFGQVIQGLGLQKRRHASACSTLQLATNIQQVTLVLGRVVYATLPVLYWEMEEGTTADLEHGPLKFASPVFIRFSPTISEKTCA